MTDSPNPAETATVTTAQPFGGTTRVVISGSQTPGSTPDPQTPGKPAEPSSEVPAKFLNADGSVNVAALAKSFKELEKRFHGGDRGQEPDPPSAPSDADAAARAATQAAGIDYAALVSEFQTAGKLSDATYDRLKAAGIDRTVVDDYVGLKTREADARRAEILAEVGGQEGFTRLSEWAKTSLSEAELAAYNKIANGTDYEATRIALRGIQAKFQKAVGVDPRLLKGQTGPATGDRYESSAQWLADLRKTDDRGRNLYEVDGAYRAKVDARLSRSRF